MLGVDPRTVRRYVAGREVPQTIQILLAIYERDPSLMEFVRSLSPPVNQGTSHE